MVLLMAFEWKYQVVVDLAVLGSTGPGIQVWICEPSGH